MQSLLQTLTGCMKSITQNIKGTTFLSSGSCGLLALWRQPVPELSSRFQVSRRFAVTSSSNMNQDVTDGPSSGSGGEGEVGEESKEALEERKRKTVQSYLEQQLGTSDPDRVTLALLLQHHGVAVRGGQAEALRLLEALKAWKVNEWTAPQQPRS